MFSLLMAAHDGQGYEIEPPHPELSGTGQHGLLLFCILEMQPSCGSNYVSGFETPKTLQRASGFSIASTRKCASARRETDVPFDGRLSFCARYMASSSSFRNPHRANVQFKSDSFRISSMRVALRTTFGTTNRRIFSSRVRAGNRSAVDVTSTLLRPVSRAASTMADADLKYTDVAVFVGLRPPNVEITTSCPRRTLFRNVGSQGSPTLNISLSWRVPGCLPADRTTP
jgi:hypothetical protein